MKSELPKQFLTLAGRPVLMHTIEAFHFNDIQIIVVLPPDQEQTWKQLCSQQDFNVPHRIVSGGQKRFHSVKIGLNAIAGSTGLVAIHDGVRPLVSRRVIRHSFEQAAIKGNAIVSVSLKDSLRAVHSNKNSAVNRRDFRLIQTPQTFQLELIRSAFNTDYQDIFTDDASVLEHWGETINLIEGDYQNIKITTREDLLIAQAFKGYF